MKKLRVMLYGAVAMLLASIVTTPLMAGSSDFAGPYIAIQAQANGAVMNGTATSGGDNAGNTTNGTLGKTFASTGVQLGYAFPAGESVLLGIDLTYQPGKGKISLDAGSANTDGDTDDVTIDMGDIYSGSIMAMVSVSDSSAVYAKVGMSQASLDWTGSVDTSLNSSVRGEHVAIGSRTLYGSGAFIQTEVGVMDFDTISVDHINSGGSATANPESVYGSVAIGFRF